MTHSGYFKRSPDLAIVRKVCRRNFFILALTFFSIVSFGKCVFAQNQGTLPSSQHIPVRLPVPPRNLQNVTTTTDNSVIPRFETPASAPISGPYQQNVQNGQNIRVQSPHVVQQQGLPLQYAQQNPLRNQQNPAPSQAKTLTFPVHNSGPATTFARQVNYQDDPPPNGGAGYPVLPPVKTPEVPKDAVTQSISLQNLNASEFKKKILEKLGGRCVPVINVQAPGNISHLQMVTAGNTLLDLVIDNQGDRVRITGSKSAVDSFVKIAQMLDAKNDPPETDTDVAPFHGVNYKAVQQTVTAIQQGQQDTWRPNANAGRPDPRATIIDAAGGPLDQLADSGLLGPVQIEILDGLDYVVTKGNRRDVEIVRRLIDQIERTGAEQEPTVVIHPLKHTDCTRIGTLVRLLYNEIYGTRRGTLNITSLVKPNALLLVGKKESIETAIELVEKLDTEVDPNHRFKIVRLKYISATDAKTILDGFYTASLAQQMDTLVETISDVRTNSLILRGSERDILEALAMIEKIDVDESASENEYKIFQLLNSNASNLATILQNSLTGTGTTAAGGFGALGTQQTGTARRTMLEFRGLDARDGGTIRSGIMTSDIRITAEPNGNLLLVNAPIKSMPLIEAIIKELDQIPTAQSKIDVYTIANGDAYQLYMMLQNLFQTTTGMGVGGVGGANNIITALPGTAEGESAMLQLRFYYDTRTNSIIAIGSEGNLLMVEALLERLDDPNAQNRKVSVFRLLNAPAERLATTLQGYLTQTRQIEMTDPNLFSVFEQYHREVIVVADVTDNSLIVSATPQLYDDIRKIIKELDRREPMVVIQVLIAEVTLNNMNEFGVELGLQDSILFDRSKVFNFNNVALGEENVNPSRVGTQGLTNLDVGRKNSNGYGGFVFSASSESVSVLLRALEERNKLQVLSRPQINALNNQRASLQVGKNIPYTESSVTSTGIVSPNIRWVPVGVILDVTPRISPDGMVIMNIYAEKSKANMISIGSVSGNNDVWVPEVALSTVQSVVSAMDGQTIVIGGLITNETEQMVRSVPFISKVPVVGRLFEYRSNKCERKEILVIMTPMIQRSDEDVAFLRNREQQRIHWCVNDVMSISDARGLRKRGDYYSPSETRVVPFSGYVPDSQLQMLDQSTSQEIPIIPGMPNQSFPNMNHEFPTPQFQQRQPQPPTRN